MYYRTNLKMNKPFSIDGVTSKQSRFYIWVAIDNVLCLLLLYQRDNNLLNNVEYQNRNSYNHFPLRLIMKSIENHQFINRQLNTVEFLASIAQPYKV